MGIEADLSIRRVVGPRLTWLKGRKMRRYWRATRFARSRADKRHYLITVSNYHLLHAAACPAATLRH